MVIGPVRKVGFVSLLLNRAPPNRFHSVLHAASRQKAKPPRSPLRVSKKLSVTPENMVVVTELLRSNVRSPLTSKPPWNDWNEASDDGFCGSVNVMV